MAMIVGCESQPISAAGSHTRESLARSCVLPCAVQGGRVSTPAPNPSFQTAMSVLSHICVAPILGRLRAVPGQPNVGIAVLDIAMMQCGGEARQRTESEYEELFAATGFGLTRVVGTGTAFSILEARPS